jgi:hypothetical protein
MVCLVVPIAKFADNAPFGTVTVAGTVATVDASTLRATVVSTAAAFASFTVPVALLPLITVAGAMVTLATAVGVTTNVVDTGTPFAVTVIVTDFATPTATVDAVNAAAVLPSATTWLAGDIVTLGSELVTVTVTPPVGAGSESVTAPLLAIPPTTVGGVKTTLLTITGRTLRVPLVV